VLSDLTIHDTRNEVMFSSDTNKLPFQRFTKHFLNDIDAEHCHQTVFVQLVQT